MGTRPEKRLHHPVRLTAEVSQERSKRLVHRYKKSAAGRVVRNVREPMPMDRKSCASSSAISNVFQPPSCPMASRIRSAGRTAAVTDMLPDGSATRRGPGTDLP